MKEVYSIWGISSVRENLIGIYSSRELALKEAEKMSEQEDNKYKTMLVCLNVLDSNGVEASVAQYECI